MEENEKEGFQNVQNKIKELILELQDGQQERLGDLSQLNEKTLIAMEQALRFWCADAIIRSGRLPKDSDLDPWELYYKAEEIAAGLNLAELTKCYLQTRDAKSVIALIIVRLDIVSFQKEAERRFQLLKVGKAFAHLLDHDFNKEALTLLLNVLGRQENSLLLKMGWKKGPGVKKQLSALRAKESDKQKERQKKKGPTKEPGDYENEALLQTLNLYDERKKAIELDDIESIPVSMISEFRKPNNFLWEAQAPVVKNDLLRDAIETRLPILNGGMETATFEIYDDQKAKDRSKLISVEGHKMCKSCGCLQLDDSPKCLECGGDRFTKRISPSISTLDDEDSEEMTKFDRSHFEALKKKMISGYKRGRKFNDILTVDDWTIQKEEEEKAVEKLTPKMSNQDILKLIENNLEGQIKIKRKVMKAFKLILLKDIPEQEALRIVKLPDRTMRDYIKKLEVKLTTYPS